MPRIPFCEEVETPAEVADLFEESRRQWGSVPNLFRLMGRAPAFVRAWLAKDKGLRLERLKSGEVEFVKLEELMIVKASAINACSH